MAVNIILNLTQCAESTMFNNCEQVAILSSMTDIHVGANKVSIPQSKINTTPDLINTTSDALVFSHHTMQHSDVTYSKL